MDHRFQKYLLNAPKKVSTPCSNYNEFQENVDARLDENEQIPFSPEKVTENKGAKKNYFPRQHSPFLAFEN